MSADGNLQTEAQPYFSGVCELPLISSSWSQSWLHFGITAADAAKLLQSCPTLCNPIDGSPSGSSVHRIFQARVLEWGAIAFSVGITGSLKKQKAHQLNTVSLSRIWCQVFFLSATGDSRAAQVRTFEFELRQQVSGFHCELKSPGQL